MQNITFELPLFLTKYRISTKPLMLVFDKQLNINEIFSILLVFFYKRLTPARLEFITSDLSIMWKFCKRILFVIRFFFAQRTYWFDTEKRIISMSPYISDFQVPKVQSGKNKWFTN